jgi:hypothetical protein
LSALVFALATVNPRLGHAAWTLRERASGDAPGQLPIATVTQGGRALDIQVDAQRHIWLTFSLPTSEVTLAIAQCPTFQIDRKQPLIHPPLGESCGVTATSAKLLLGQLAKGGVVSDVLYALVNGNQLAVRFVTSERRYAETVFPLSHSKRAIKQALGGRRIRPR